MKCVRCGFECFFGEESQGQKRYIFKKIGGNPLLSLCENCLVHTQGAWERLKHFNRRERWGEPSLMDAKLLYWAEAAREVVGVPFIVNCAYEITGHSARSFHYLGQAADFHIGCSECLRSFLRINEIWPGGLGIYPYWENAGLHLDVGDMRRWWRDKNGNYITCSKSALKKVIKDLAG